MTQLLHTTNRSRLLVISDIHGYTEGLRGLLRLAKYNSKQDQLILLGDYIEVDKQVTWAILDSIIHLTQNGAIALPGNHELKLISLLRKRNNRHQNYVKWIKKLPAYYCLNNYLFVHAGIRPGVAMSEQTVSDLTSIREPFWTDSLSNLAQFLQLGQQNVKQSIQAFTTCLRIVFGHTQTFKLGVPPGHIWSDKHRIAIDTGAKNHDRLTLLDLTEGTTYSCRTMRFYRTSDYRIESVKQHLL